jgi:acetyltransferase-like isoleucine patch superfamily enzyme
VYAAGVQYISENTSEIMKMIINALFNVADVVLWRMNSFFCTACVMVTATCRGIAIGGGSSFYGLPTFKRSRTGVIRIGKNNCFRSAHTSNLIGVNRPCIISALSANARILIGDNCGFSGTVIGCFSSIIIGDHVKCGANTLITDGDWHPEDPRSSAPKPIVIGDNVWLGVNVTVMKGVIIGANSLIGAGSIVTRDIPPNVIAAGNPCKVIRSIV